MSTRSRANRTARANDIVRFGPFEFHPRAADLRRGGTRVRLQEQPLRILTALLERPGEVVTREEIRQRLWPNGTVVEVSHGINAAIQRLREALGETAENPRYVETLARRGYRFIAPMEAGEISAAASPAADTFPDNSPPPVEVSHFRVLERLGAGGMGVVYRAEDLKLGRFVALKFLPDELAHDPAALARFRREAQAASALSHPNICTIYGIEECQGKPVIVMEYIEGESLESLLRRGPVPAEQALQISIRMADALDAAHRAGIIHRDLKPANVLIPDPANAATLKVLDFGLAKMDRAPALGFEPPHLTREGAILGTLHYLSPEQAQGQPAEPRSDIFSLGAVLYELLSGRRAFDGPNPARVMAAILALDPPLLFPAVSPALDSAVRRCLAKEPEARWQSARNLKAALESVGAAPPAAATQLPAHSRVWPIAGVAAVFLLTALAALSFLPRGASPTMAAAPIAGTAKPATAPLTDSARAGQIATVPPSPQRREASAAQVTTVSVSSPVAKLALSPDGKRVAYTSHDRLYVAPTNGGEPKLFGAVTGTPFWAPDGRSFAAATADGQLMRFDANSSTGVALCKVNTQLAGAWSPSGDILIGLMRDGVYRVPAGGGELERFTQLVSARDDARHIVMQVLPGGRLLYIAASQIPGASVLYAADLRTAESTPVMPIDSNVQYAEGFLIYDDGARLVARRFDWKTLKLAGEPKPLDAAPPTDMAANALVKLARFSVAGDKLAYAAKTGGITLIDHWTAGFQERERQ